MSHHDPAPTPRSRCRSAPLLLAAAALLGPLLVACSGDDDQPGEGAHEGMAHEGMATGDDACSELYNASFMHWNPSYADQLTALGCEWPFPPGSVSTDGGAVDPALDAAPFEPVTYQQVWDAVVAGGFGVCAVERVPPTSVTGFVYGFRYQTRSGGCAEGDPDSGIVLLEMAARAQRDAAAHASSAPVALVLGRWVVEADGDAAQDAAAAVESIGAIPVTG